MADKKPVEWDNDKILKAVGDVMQKKEQPVMPETELIPLRPEEYDSLMKKAQAYDAEEKQSAWRRSWKGLAAIIGLYGFACAGSFFFGRWYEIENRPASVRTQEATEAELKNYKKRFFDKELELIKTKTELAVTKTFADSAKPDVQKIASLEATIENYKKNDSEKAKTLAAAQADAAKLREDYSKKSAEFEAYKRAAEETAKKSAEEHAKKIAEVEALKKAELAVKDSLLNKKDARISELDKSNTDYAKEGADRAVELIRLKKDLADKDAKISALEAKANDVELTRNREEEEFRKYLATEKSELVKKIAELEATIKDVKSGSLQPSQGAPSAAPKDAVPVNLNGTYYSVSQAERDALNSIKGFQMTAGIKDYHVCDITLANVELTKVPDVFSIFKYLKHVNLTGNKIRNVKPLVGLPDLKMLVLTNQGLTSFSEVEGLLELSQLNYLLVSGNKFANYDGIEKLSQLTFLDIEGSTVEDTSVFSKLLNLQGLDLSHSGVSDVSGLKGCPLRYLYLVGNGIRQPKGFDSLPYLENLIIIGNPLLDLIGLEALKNLKNLDVSSCLLGKKTGLGNAVFPSYQMSGFEKFPKLEVIRATNNDYRGIVGLENLKNLKEVYVYGNPINWENADVKATVAKLLERRVKIYATPPNEKGELVPLK
jgi:Leucine-rich repeat (LRR) protein